MRTLVGALGADVAAVVDGSGVITSQQGDLEVSLWLSADETWSDPRADTTLRSTHVGGGPVIETRRRCGGGDVTQRVFGVAGGAGSLVVELDNASPSAVAVALVVRPVGASRARFESHDGGLSVGADMHLCFAGPVRRWLVADDDGLRDSLERGDGVPGPVEAGELRGGQSLVMLFAVPHVITWRAAVVAGADQTLDPRGLPDSHAVARGWGIALERGMRVELADEAILDAVDLARSQVLLAAQSAGRHDWELTAVLEDWGFDDQAERLWAKLSTGSRRRARRRSRDEQPWATVRDLSASTDFERAAALLRAVRDVLVDDTEPGEVRILPDLPPDWLGVPVAVHDAPSAQGSISYALRWHSERPALLWDVPEGVELSAPLLDPSWRSVGGRGEALLSAPSGELLRLRTAPERAGDPIAEPGSFI